MRRRSIARRVGLLAALVAALLACTGCVPPALASTDDVHGVVTDRGHAVAGVRVGYTDVGTVVRTPSGIRISTTATARTDSHGRFTIHLPTAPGTGFVWAGLQPTERHVVFAAAGTTYVRAVIGAKTPKGAPSALFQTQHAARPSAIGGGGSIAIRLQRSARLSGTDRALHGARIILQRGDGSSVRSIAVSVSGSYRSPTLAPGRYRARLLLPGASGSTGIAAVVLRSGRITRLPSGAASRVRHRQSVVTGTVVSPKGVTKRRVRVEAHQGDRLVAAVRSTAAGKYVFRGLAPGTYTLVAGRNAPDLAREPSRVHLTPDDTVSVSRSVTVRSGTTTHRALPLRLAGHITGTTTRYRTLLIEDSSGLLVRTARADSTGRFAAGGMPTGDYTIISTDDPGYGTVGAHVIAGRTTRVGAVHATRALFTVHGTVPAVARAPGEDVRVHADLEGAVTGYDTQFASTVTGAGADAAGAWTVQSVIPGRYTFRAWSSFLEEVPADSLGHAAGSPSTRAITAASAHDSIALDLGPKAGRLAGTFRSTGGPGIGYIPGEIAPVSGIPSAFADQTAVDSFSLDAVPGTYRWRRTEGQDDETAVATDGPWWASPTDPALTVPTGIRRGVVVPLTFHH